MLNEKEQEFARVTVEMGLVSQDQIQEAVRIKTTMVELGVKPKDIATILREKEYISEEGMRSAITRVKSPTGRKVAGFEIIERLSQGAMGIVYKARQVSMDRVVALKVLSKDLKRKPHHVERFLREARAVARFTHKNIVGGIDAGVDGDIYYFAMEFVEGEPLRTKIHRQGRLEPREALEITLQMAEALECASGQGILHRDIKPDNIMITRDGVAKLCDLGLAKIGDTGDTHLTQEGMSMGTPDYISPEQARGESNLDIRTDIYSLGATFFQMITGRTPYDGENAMVVMTKHLTEPMPTFASCGAPVGEDVEALLRKMTAKDRDQRYATPTDLRRDVETILAGGSIASGPTGIRRRPTSAARSGTRAMRPRQSRGTLGLGLAAGAGVLLSIGAVLYLASGGDPEDPVDVPNPPAGQGDKSAGSGKTTDPNPNGGRPVDPVQPTRGPDDDDYAALEKYAGQNQREFARIIDLANAFLARHAQSRHAGAVRVILDGARERAEVAAEDELLAIALAADAHEKLDHLWAAASEYDRFSSSLKGTQVWLREGLPAQRKLLDRIQERWTVDKEKWEEAAAAGRFQEAIAILDLVPEWADPDRKEEAAGIRTQLEKSAQAGPPAADEREPFVAFARNFVAGLGVGKWNWTAAEAALEGTKFTQEPFVRHWRGFQSDLQLLQSLPEVTRNALRSKIGQTLTLPVGECEIKAVETDRVRLQQGAAELAFSFPELPPDVLFHDILSTPGAGLAEVDRFRFMAIHQLWSANQARENSPPKIPSARQSLSRVQQILGELGRRGADVERWNEVRERVDREVKELEAAELFRLAQEEMKRARRSAERRTLWVSPIVRLRRLQSGEFSETRFAQEHLQEIEQLLTEAEEARGSGS